MKITTTTAPLFIRLTYYSIAIDKILYITDNSSPGHPSIRITFAGGISGHIQAKEPTPHGPLYGGIWSPATLELTGEDAQAFLDWQEQYTLTLVPRPKKHQQS